MDFFTVAAELPTDEGRDPSLWNPMCHATFQFGPPSLLFSSLFFDVALLTESSSCSKKAPPLPSLPLWRRAVSQFGRSAFLLFGLCSQIGASESGKKCILPPPLRVGSFFNLSLEDICGHPQTLRPHAQLHTLRFARMPAMVKERREGDPSSRTKPFLQSPPPPLYHSARSSSPPPPSQSQCCE